MSYLPPEQAGFFEAVQVYFTEATGRVALFGARDRSLLQQWSDEERPARVVCRGIREAVKSYGRDDPPRSLAQCEPFVDDEWEQYRERNVGAHDAEDSRGSDESTDRGGDDEQGELYVRVQRAIERAGRCAEQERWRRAYRRAWRKLNEYAEAFDFQQLQVLDEAMVEAYLDALDEQERQLLEEQLAGVDSGLLQGMSPSARRQHLHAKRKRELIDRYGLLDLFEVV